MCMVTSHRDELATRALDDQQLLAIEGCPAGTELREDGSGNAVK